MHAKRAIFTDNSAPKCVVTIQDEALSGFSKECRDDRGLVLSHRAHQNIGETYPCEEVEAFIP